jgi:hypothetical protein
MVNILCDEYRCRKKVWQKSDKNQWAKKKISIGILVAIYDGLVIHGLNKL